MRCEANPRWRAVVGVDASVDPGVGRIGARGTVPPSGDYSVL